MGYFTVIYRDNIDGALKYWQGDADNISIASDLAEAADPTFGYRTAVIRDMTDEFRDRMVGIPREMWTPRPITQ